MTETESVWDYPRPPRLEPSPRHILVVHDDRSIADSRQCLRILETSHPPVYYIPVADLSMQWLQPSKARSSFCEYKGFAQYWSLEIPGFSSVADVAWSYPEPSPAYAALRDHLAFYATKVDMCLVDGERVQPQPGDFYGGWITSHVRGPFKGPPGTLGW